MEERASRFSPGCLLFSLLLITATWYWNFASPSCWISVKSNGCPFQQTFHSGSRLAGQILRMARLTTVSHWLINFYITISFYLFLFIRLFFLETVLHHQFEIVETDLQLSPIFTFSFIYPPGSKFISYFLSSAPIYYFGYTNPTSSSNSIIPLPSYITHSYFIQRIKAGFETSFLLQFWEIIIGRYKLTVVYDSIIIGVDHLENTGTQCRGLLFWPPWRFESLNKSKLTICEL